MKATVVKKVSFDAAHWLPDYPGKCANLHGHHWEVEVGFGGEIDGKTGMVIDFSLVKEVLQRVIGNFDHGCLNNVLPVPTAENVAGFIIDALSAAWLKQNGKFTITTKGPFAGVKLEFVRVWETPDSYVEVRQ